MTFHAFRCAATTFVAMALFVAIPAGVATAASSLYVANSVSSNLSGFTVGAGGLPVGIGSGPFTTAGPGRAVNFLPDATRLYQANYTGNSVSGWTIDGAGSLTSLGAAVPSIQAPSNSAIAPNGKTQYFSSVFNDAGVQAFRINADGSQQAIDTEFTDGNGSDLIVTPDNRFLLSCSTAGLWGFSIAADGTLTAIPTMSPESGTSVCNGLAVTPDGSTLIYGSNAGTVYSRHINADGTTTAINSAPGGTRPDSLAIGPNGSYLVAFGMGNGGVTQPTATSIAIAQDGSLTGSGLIFNTSAAGTFGVGGAISPDGAFAYQHVGTAGNNLFGFSVTETGALTPLVGSPFISGGSSNFQARQSIGFKPHQGPISSLSISGTGNERAFSAAGSTAQSAPISSYVWDFGNGTRSVTTTPTISHTFGVPGNYTATLEAMGGACGAKMIFTGHTALCNPGRIASVTVDALPPSITKLKLTRSKFKVNKKAKALKVAKKIAVGTVVKYKLSEAVTLKLQVQKPAGGRKVGKNCVKPSKSNKKKKPCVRYVNVGKANSLPAAAGNRSTPFSGKVGKRSLKAGKYRLALTATDAEGNVSKLQAAKFTIVK